jgi:hypothetical protein
LLHPKPQHAEILEMADPPRNSREGASNHVELLKVVESRRAQHVSTPSNFTTGGEAHI